MLIKAYDREGELTENGVAEPLGVKYADYGLFRGGFRKNQKFR